MATSEQIADLRRKIGDTTEPYTYSDPVLDALIDASDGDLNAVAADIWEEKAVTFSSLVDISEAGSSRKLGDLFKNASAMATYYRGQVVEQIEAQAYTTTRPIVRP